MVREASRTRTARRRHLDLAAVAVTAGIRSEVGRNGERHVRRWVRNQTLAKTVSIDYGAFGPTIADHASVRNSIRALSGGRRSFSLDTSGEPRASGRILSRSPSGRPHRRDLPLSAPAWGAADTWRCALLPPVRSRTDPIGSVEAASGRRAGNPSRPDPALRRLRSARDDERGLSDPPPFSRNEDQENGGCSVRREGPEAHRGGRTPGRVAPAPGGVRRCAAVPARRRLLAAA